MRMLQRILPCLLSFLVLYGCSASAPPDKTPSCGPPIDVDGVRVVEAEELDADGNVDAIVSYATRQVGPFRLLSTSTFRIDSWPIRPDQPRWVHARDATASNGCDVMIVVDSAMVRSKSRGGLDGPGSPTLHHYVLMGSSASE
jgi:hypothetical protein